MRSDKDDLLKKIAKLESVNDQLLTEIRYLDALMRRVGFSAGLETVKATAIEIIEKGYAKDKSFPPKAEDNNI